MKLKLMVDGSDQRIRIEPTKGKTDKKLLEYIAEWDLARIVIKRDTYVRDIEIIDLILETKPEQTNKDGEVVIKDIIFPQSN